jgi:uncharacterized membrane protein YcaP (DUF421 family)
MQSMFFHSWGDIGRVVIVSIVIFVAIVGMLRMVGQVALAKMSGYDVIFTVTLGSLVATVVLTRTLTISEALAAFITLLALQMSVRWLQARWLLAHRAVREPPNVVLWDGQLLEDRMRHSSISGDEVRAAVRRSGLRSLSDVRAVVLENDGDWSVIPKSSDESDESALFGLPIPGRPDGSPARNTERATPTTPYRLP